MPLKYKKELLKFKLSKDKYCIFGSGPLAIRDLKENDDLDLAVKENFYKQLKNKYPINKEYPKTSVRLSKKIVAFNNKFLYSKINFKKDVELVDGLPFVDLKKALAMKIKYYKIKNRKKDKEDIEFLKKYLKK